LGRLAKRAKERLAITASGSGEGKSRFANMGPVVNSALVSAVVAAAVGPAATYYFFGPSKEYAERGLLRVDPVFVFINGQDFANNQYTGAEQVVEDHRLRNVGGRPLRDIQFYLDRPKDGTSIPKIEVAGWIVQESMQSDRYVVYKLMGLLPHGDMLNVRYEGLYGAGRFVVTEHGDRLPLKASPEWMGLIPAPRPSSIASGAR
jgi:hypothetical protein